MPDAIRTMYRGISFRSRLEAKWARKAAEFAGEKRREKPQEYGSRSGTIERIGDLFDIKKGGGK